MRSDVEDLVFVEQRPMRGRVIRPQPGLTIGRVGCEVVLPDPEVSRRHARVVVAPSAAPAINDLGSTNGTWVNGRRVEGVTELAAGDEVRFGNTVWRVQASDAVTLISDA